MTRQRIKDVCVIGLTFLTVLLASPTANATFGSCDDPYDFVFFRFELRQAVRNERGDFIGTFEIENARFDEAIEIAGTMNHGVLEVEYPHLRLEFMDLTGSWRSFLYAPGTFLTPPDKLSVSRCAKASFVAQLPTKEELGLGGLKFRALLSVVPNICIQSEPLVVVQKRGPIEGFTREERSNKVLQKSHSTQGASAR